MLRHIENLLEDKTRQAIYELVKSNPGITQSEVSRLLKRSMGSVVYHMRALEDRNLIVSRVDRYRHYFLNGGLIDPKHKDIIIALHPDTAFKIVEMLAKFGPSSPRNISLNLSVSCSLIYPHLRLLIKQGVIQRLQESESGRLCKYALIDPKLIKSIMDEYPNLLLRRST